VRFDVRGGDRDGAMALGLVIRANRWDTGVGRMGEAAYMPEPGQCRGAGLLAYAGAKSLGWAGHQPNPAFFVGFEVPTDRYAEVIAGWFADSCGPLRDWTTGEQP
jgi:hypothetical protein